MLALLFVLAVTGTVAVVQSRRNDQMRMELAAMTEQLDEMQQQVADAEAAGEQPQGGGAEEPSTTAPTAPDDATEGSVFEDVIEQLEDLLGSLPEGGEESGGTGIPGLPDTGGDGAGDVLGDAEAQAALLPCVSGVDDLPDTDPSQPLDDVVAQISEQVTDLRGHEFPEPVTATFLEGPELEARIRELVAAEYPAQQAEIDARLLTTIGALAPGTDLVAAQQDLLGGQVAGFYDPDTGELVVGTDGGEPGATELITLAHELEHALADAVIGLPGSDDPLTDDADVAALAVVEGDAVVLQSQYQQVAISPGLLIEELLGGDLQTAQEDLAQAPPYLAASLIFPYTDGAAYVCGRYQEGGWEAVDATLAAPPGSTLEILDPSQVGFAPADPRDPTLAAPWASIDVRTFGAADLMWLLQAPGADADAAFDDARERALDWRGGEAHTFADGDRTTVVLAFEGEPTLCTTLESYYGAAFPDAESQAAPQGTEAVWESPSQAAALECDQGSARLAIAPDLTTALTAAA